jgi:hypothetical protein
MPRQKEEPLSGVRNLQRHSGCWQGRRSRQGRVPPAQREIKKVNVRIQRNTSFSIIESSVTGKSMETKRNERDAGKGFAAKMRRIWPGASTEEVEKALAKVIFNHFAGPVYVRNPMSGEAKET